MRRPRRCARPKRRRPMPVPSPQRPFRSGPIHRVARWKPPAIAWCFKGATTNHATSVGKIAPKTVAIRTSAGPSQRLSAIARITPHTPPQNASDHTCGNPHGPTAFIENAAFCVRPAECSIAAAPWWKISTAKAPAKNPTVSQRERLCTPKRRTAWVVMTFLTCRPRRRFARAPEPFGSPRQGVEGDEGGELGDEEELVGALELVLHRD